MPPAVGKLAVKGDPVLAFRHAGNVRFGAAQGGKVKLVGFVGQLGDAGDVEGRKALDLRVHAKALQAFLHSAPKPRPMVHAVSQTIPIRKTK